MVEIFFRPFLLNRLLLVMTGVSKVFVNTALVNQTKGSGYLVQDWSEEAGIGSHKGKRFLNGFVDEVYIFTSALTPHEIKRLACVCAESAHVQGKLSDLVSLYLLLQTR